MPGGLGGPIQPAQFCQSALEIGGGILRITTDLDVLLEHAKELILTAACGEHGSSCAYR